MSGSPAARRSSRARRARVSGRMKRTTTTTKHGVRSPWGQRCTTNSENTPRTTRTAGACRDRGCECADATHRRIPEDSPARQARSGVARTHVSARDDDAAPSQRAAGRPVSRTLSQVREAPPLGTHSPAKPQQPALCSSASAAGARPDRRRPGNGRGAQVDPAAAPYQDHDRYMRIAQNPNAPGRRAVSVGAGLRPPSSAWCCSCRACPPTSR